VGLSSFTLSGARDWVLLGVFQGHAFQTCVTESGAAGTVSSMQLGSPLSCGGFAAGDAAGATFLFNGNGHATKFDGTGKQVWSKLIPFSGVTPNAAGVAADGAGGAFLAGTLSSAFDLGCGMLPGGPFVARLGDCGACTWSSAFSGSIILSTLQLLPTEAGQIYVTGNFQGAVDLGCGALTSAGTSAFIAKIDAGGACLWSRAFTTASLGVGVFPGGDLLLAAAFHGTIDFGGGPLQSVGAEDGAVARLSASGAQLWSERFGAPGATVAWTGPSVDPTGGAALSALVKGGSVDFGDGAVAPGGVLLKLDPGGALRWQQAPFAGVFASDPCGAVIAASSNGSEISVVKFAP
jgi:hypothetical protein